MKRRWQCQYDGHLNEAGTTKCAGKCHSKRAKKASSWEAEARLLHRRAVVRPGAVCFVCGTSRGLQDAHIFGRGANPSPAVKWHPLNGIPLCGPGGNGCHYKFDSYQLERDKIIAERLGPEGLRELHYWTGRRWDRDWPGVIERLRIVV